MCFSFAILAITKKNSQSRSGFVVVVVFFRCCFWEGGGGLMSDQAEALYQSLNVTIPIGEPSTWLFHYIL